MLEDVVRDRRLPTPLKDDLPGRELGEVVEHYGIVLRAGDAPQGSSFKEYVDWMVNARVQPMLEAFYADRPERAGEMAFHVAEVTTNQLDYSFLPGDAQEIEIVLERNEETGHVMVRTSGTAPWNPQEQRYRDAKVKPVRIGMPNRGQGIGWLKEYADFVAFSERGDAVHLGYDLRPALQAANQG